MRISSAAVAPACAALLALAGCAGREMLAEPLARSGLPPQVELRDAPFFPQRDYQCGPAALATILVAAGVPVRPDELVAEVYLPGRRGSLQAELVAATRSRDRLPYLVTPDLSSLIAQVAAGRPVLVLQKTGAGPWPGWHYAVVVGYDLARDVLLLRSGNEARLEIRTPDFVATWERAGRWALTALEPGSMPAVADYGRYMEAAAGLEDVGRTASAELAYEAAAREWPGQSLPQLGLANVAYARGDLAGAERNLRAAIERERGDLVARNNRAAVLLRMGCPAAARREIEVAASLATDGPHVAAVAATRREIGSTGVVDRPGCPPDTATAHSRP
jgi:tetratricopeptide (TPR) repeat protein